MSTSASSIGDTGAKVEFAPPGRLVLLLLTVLTDSWRDGIDGMFWFWLNALRGGIALDWDWIAPDPYGPFPPVAVEDVIAVTLLRIEAVRVMTPSLDGPDRSGCCCGLGASMTGDEVVLSLSFDSMVSARSRELRTSMHLEFLV